MFNFNPDDFAADSLDAQADNWADYRDWLLSEGEEEFPLDEPEDRFLDAQFEDRWEIDFHDF